VAQPNNNANTICPSHGVTPKEARDARARTWRFVFDCWEQKKAAKSSGGEEQARREVEQVSRTRLVEYLQEQDFADAVRK
jgi:hypothetical protein